MMRTKKFVLWLSLMIITTNIACFTIGDSYKDHKKHNNLNFSTEIPILSWLNFTNKNPENFNKQKSENNILLSWDILNSPNGNYRLFISEINKSRNIKKNEEIFSVLNDEEIEKFKDIMKKFRDAEYKIFKKIKNAQTEEEKNLAIKESQEMREYYKKNFEDNFWNLFEINMEYWKKVR